MLHHKPVVFFSDNVHCLFQCVRNQPYFSCKVFQSNRFFFFSRGHDTITQVRRARFLTDVGDLPLSVSLSPSLTRSLWPIRKRNRNQKLSHGWRCHEVLDHDSFPLADPLKNLNSEAFVWAALSRSFGPQSAKWRKGSRAEPEEENDDGESLTKLTGGLAKWRLKDGKFPAKAVDWAHW